MNLDNFHMSGKKMIEMGREAFLSRSPPFMGDILWEHLDVLQRGSFNFVHFEIRSKFYSKGLLTVRVSFA